MSDREDQLRRDAVAMADAIDRDLHGTFGPIADHAERVRDMAQELTLVADRATERVEALGASGDSANKAGLSELSAMAEILRSLAGELHIMAQRSVQDLDHLKGSLIQAVRANAIGNRRRYERVDVDVPAEAHFEGRNEPARVLNLSLGGAKMDLAINRSVGTTVSLRMAGLAHELSGEVVRVTEGGTQLRFIIGDEAANELRRFLDRIGLAKHGNAT